MLEALEDEARALGYSLVRLETGKLQAAAIGFYISAGFGPIPRYGPFADDPKSVCFEKRSTRRAWRNVARRRGAMVVPKRTQVRS